MPRPNPFQTFTHCWRFALRDELLDGESFYSLAEAKVLIEAWWRHYTLFVRTAASGTVRRPGRGCSVATESGRELEHELLSPG